MPRIYLHSNSVETNQIADAMEPLLVANGIDYVRSAPGMTTNQVIAQSNAEGVDAHIALSAGVSAMVHYFTTSQNGKRLAQDIAQELGINTSPNMNLPELRQTRAPAVVAQLGFHIQNSIQNIAQALVRAIVRYFGMQYVAPCTMGTHNAEGFNYSGFRWGQVCTQTENLNIRRSPSGEVLFTLAPGTQLIITGPSVNGWVPVRYNHWEGYAASRFICVCNVVGNIVPPIGTVPPIMPPIGTIPPMPPEPPRPPIVIPPPPPITPVPPIGIVPPIMPPIVPPPTPTCPEPYMATVSTQGGRLNLRSRPTTAAAIIDHIPNNSRILVLRQEGDWLYVFWNNHLGWVSADYVAK